MSKSISNSSSKDAALITGASTGIGAVYADRLNEARLTSETGGSVNALRADLNNKVADIKLNSFWRAVVISDDLPAPMNETIELSIDSKLELVETVVSLAKSASAKLGFDEDEAGRIELAAHEAVVNAIKHGNQYSADKQVDVRFLIEQDAMTIYVRDQGKGVDPTRLPDPLAPENLLKPSGRGILWMRTFMDEVEYSAHPDGGCVVRMKKYQRSSAKQPVDLGIIFEVGQRYRISETQYLDMGMSSHP
jgi:serine/threonine-protein kinase RsbW